MQIVLKRGEYVDIKLANADSGFRVVYGETQVDVRAELADTQGRVGLIYREKFGGSKVVRPVAPTGSFGGAGSDEA